MCQYIFTKYFTAKDYKNNSAPIEVTLSCLEFVRRFMMHVLPPGFQKIRYYGFLNNRYRKDNLALIFRLQGRRQSSPCWPGFPWMRFSIRSGDISSMYALSVAALVCVPWAGRTCQGNEAWSSICCTAFLAGGLFAAHSFKFLRVYVIAWQLISAFRL